MNRIRLLMAMGIVLLGLGISEILFPGLIPVTITESILYIVGAGILLYAYLVYDRRKTSAYTEVDPPSPEFRIPTPTPGQELETVLERFINRSQLQFESKTIHGLREAAVQTLITFGGVSNSAARTAVSNGTWTENSRAASFLGDADEQSLSDRLGTILAAPASFRSSVSQTIFAIADQASIETQLDTDSRRLFRVNSLRRNRSGDSINQHEISPVSTRVFKRTQEANAQFHTTQTNHWYGATILALVCIGGGLIFERPAILLASTIGIGYAAYARIGVLPPVELQVDRSISPTDPSPEEPVTVTVTVTNTGSTPIPDLRLVDGVPAALSVESGSPRFGSPFLSGQQRTFTYTLTAERGKHQFGPLVAITKNLPASLERVQTIDVETTLECVPTLASTNRNIPLKRQAGPFAGQTETQDGGEGIEFYATRQYRTGDARTRIDWRRYARTGELSTLEFREERAATVMLLIDVQPSAYLGPTPTDHHAVDQSVAAAGRTFVRLLNDGHRVGLATLGAPDGWISPAAGKAQKLRGERALALDQAFSPVPHHEQGNILHWRNRLRRRLPRGAQVIIFSPLCEPFTTQTIKRLKAYGHGLLVVSPDPTTTSTPPEILATIGRNIQISNLRDQGVSVIDWDPSIPYDTALNQHRLVVTQ